MNAVIVENIIKRYGTKKAPVVALQGINDPDTTQRIGNARLVTHLFCQLQTLIVILQRLLAIATHAVDVALQTQYCKNSRFIG